MNPIFISLCEIIVLIAMVLFLFAMVKAKNIPNRILAFESVILCVVCLIILHCASIRSVQFLELVLTVSALGFIGTTATVYYWQQRLKQNEDTDKEEIDS